MVTAVVLINVDHGRIQEVANALIALDGVAEVYSVGGRYDLVAMIRTRTNEEMAELVTGHMLTIPNINNTETLIAFKAYSSYDLERMFAIGNE